MLLSKVNRLYLISSGLGAINRGFENHIACLGDAMLSEPKHSYSTQVFGSRRIQNRPYKVIFAISRNNWILLKLKLVWRTRFSIEQFSFLMFLLPKIIIERPKIIYLAEYDMYCWLYKIRKLLGLSYHLIYYTGGGAIPSLFNKEKDWVHHVTNNLLNQSIRMGIPENRISIIPHFVNENFQYNDKIMNEIKRVSGNKIVILVVGAMNTNHKRMDLAAWILGCTKERVFPIFVGDLTEEYIKIEGILKKYFEDQYIITQSNAREIGSYYAAADIFFTASAYEAFGLTYIEALWHGLPLVCHKHERLEDIVNKHTYSFEMNKDEITINTWKKYINEFQNTYSRDINKHQFVLKRYHWKSLKNDYINMFNQVGNFT